MQTDKPQSKSEKVATVEEVSDAIEKVSQDGWAKIYAFAKNRARFMALYGGAVDELDLVQQAIAALLQERPHLEAESGKLRWPSDRCN